MEKLIINGSGIVRQAFHFLSLTATLSERERLTPSRHTDFQTKSALV